MGRGEEQWCGLSTLSVGAEGRSLHRESVQVGTEGACFGGSLAQQAFPGTLCTFRAGSDHWLSLTEGCTVWRGGGLWKEA